MANEHVLVYETDVALPMTVANATAVEKGVCLALSDPFTAAQAVEDDIVAGILKVEKIASSGVTSKAVYRGGIFKATASGAITVGQALAFSGSNLLKAATASNVHSQIVGLSLETVAHGETFLYELRPGANNNAYS